MYQPQSSHNINLLWCLGGGKPTKGFSVNHFLNQLLVLDIDINEEFLLAALFL